MKKYEYEQLSSIVDDFEKSDDKIDVLERLYSEVKYLLNKASYNRRNKKDINRETK